MLCLAITGFEADPDEVTKLLQLEPTATVRRGELTRSGRPSRFNGWWLEAHKARVTSGGQHDAAIGVLIDHLRGREARFAILRDNLGPQQVTVYGGLYFATEEQCGVWLEPEQMKVLASCGVGWGLDLFVADDGAI
jgi:hypothetical protein